MNFENFEILISIGWKYKTYQVSSHDNPNVTDLELCIDCNLFGKTWWYYEIQTQAHREVVSRSGGAFGLII